MDYLSASNSMVLNVLALSAEGWESSGPVVISGSSCTESKSISAYLSATIGKSIKGQRLTGSVRRRSEGERMSPQEFRYSSVFEMCWLDSVLNQRCSQSLLDISISYIMQCNFYV